MEAIVAGNFDVYRVEDIEFISSDSFYSAAVGSAAEARFRKQLAQHEEIGFCRITSGGHYSQRLFHETMLFPHYITTGALPLMNLENQSRLLLATPLPNDTSNLFPHNYMLEADSFWKKWVI